MTSNAQFGFNHVCSYKEKSTYSYSYQSPRRHHASCAIDKCLYLLGGFGRYRVRLNSMEKYDCDEGKNMVEFNIFMPATGSVISVILLCWSNINPPNRYKHLSIAHDAWCLLGLCRSVNCLQCSLNVSKQYTPRFQVFLPNTGSPPDTIISLPDKKFNVK
jgi:hypothetical protein